MQLRNIVVTLGLVLATGNALAVNVVVGNGATATGTTNVVVGEFSSAGGANSAYETSVGWQTISSSFGGTALGSSAFAGGGWYNTSVGLQANISGNVDASMALGYNARVIEGAGATLTTNAVAIGTNSTVSQSYTVSFGGGITQNHRLVNLADGVDLQDAVTMGQLTTAIAGVAVGTTDQIARDAATAAQTTANSADTKATTAINAVNTITPRVNTLETMVNGFDGRIESLENRVGKIEVGVASALAMSAANSNAASAASRSEKGRAIGIGASVFAGRSVTAVSYASNFSFGTVTAAASLSASPSVQVGAGFAF
jgi:hypothetical protein